MRRSEDGVALSAPLIHDDGYERYASKVIRAACYERDHQAPMPGCRCGLHVAVEGTLDSLSGYLLDSSHDPDPPIFAEVACTGRVFIDRRGARAEQIEVIRVAADHSESPDPLHAPALRRLADRYGVQLCAPDVMPAWVLANKLPQGAPSSDSMLDLDRLVSGLGLRSVDHDP